MTVAVCTRDRPVLLERCLAALRSVPPTVRVLVVDNAPSTDASARLVEARFPGFDYVIEPRPGLDHARNRAIAESTSEVIAFTDDDVVVDDRWADAVARAFQEEPELSALTGLVLPLEIETPAQELFERLGGFGRGFVRRWETSGHLIGPDRGQGAPSSAPGSSAPAPTWHSGARSSIGLAASIRRSTSVLLLAEAATSRCSIVCLAGGQLLRYEPAAIVFHQHRRTLAELEVTDVRPRLAVGDDDVGSRGRARLDCRSSLGARAGT